MKKYALLLGMISVFLIVVLTSCTAKYTVTFQHEDGTVIETVKVREGELPSTQAVPQKESDGICRYEFVGWDKELSAVTADTSYTAVFKEIPESVEWFEYKTIVFLGDSITNCYGIYNREENGYPYLVCNELGAEIVNLGTDSRTFCDGGHRISCLEDIDKIPTDADIVIVALGVNDWDQGVKNGYLGQSLLYDSRATYYDLGEEDTDDTSTIRGAIAAYCERITEQLEKDNARLYFMTPVICAGNNSAGVSVRKTFDPTLRNIHGFTQEDMNEVIFEVCEKYGVTVIDTYNESGLDENTAYGNYDDGIHPNVFGHRMMADAVIRALKEDILGK